MADDDLVVADENFLYKKAQHALPLCYIEDTDGRAQAVEEVGHRFGEAETNFALLRLIFDCLLLQQTSLFATAELGHTIPQLFKREGTFLVSCEQTLDAFPEARKIAAAFPLGAVWDRGCAPP
ncbi:hypothetical protein ACVIHH_008504 [Bradyrhizobium sp. USDA 4518]